MRNNLRFLNKVIYSLKRDYGELVDFYKRTSSVYDISTGTKVVTRSKHTVNRAVVLPQDLARKFLYDAVLLKQDRPFAYGGLFATGDRTILVDRKDLPLNYVIELSDYLIINSRFSGIKRYEVKNVDEFEGGFTYLLTVTELKGLELSQINDLLFKDRFVFREQILVSKGKSGPKDILSFIETISYVKV